MATWITHLRIADNFIKNKSIPDTYKTEFVCGSLAPDCGYGKKDSNGKFIPPPSVTHWTEDGSKAFCDYRKFFDTYLKNRKKDSDYYFYLGYYTHLITDVLWSASIYMPARYRFADEYKANRNFIANVKKDWYMLDCGFFANSGKFEPYELLCGIDNVKDYLPYYESGQLTIQLKLIADYYKKTENDKDYKYKYLSKKELDEFIINAAELIKPKII